MVEEEIREYYARSSSRLSQSVSLPSFNFQKSFEGQPVETVESKKYTTIQWLTLITLAFGNFCVGACVSLQAPFFPKEAEKKGATPSEYGLIFGLYQLTIFATAPIMGKLISYIDPKFMLNSGIFCVGVTCVLFGLLGYVPGRAQFVGLAFAIRFLEGVGAAALRTSAYSIIAAQFMGNMATTFAVLETFMGVGLITGPTLGGALYDLGGYGLPFFVAGSLILVDALVIFFILPSPEAKRNDVKGNWFKFWWNPGILIYALVVFNTFNYIGYNAATLEPHLRQFGLSGFKLGMIFALSGALYAISAPFWGWLCDKRCDKKVLIIFGCFVMALSLLLIGPMPFLNLPSELKVTIPALALMGIAAGSKLVPTFTGSLEDTIARGFASDLTTYGLISSMFASSQSLGAFVGPSLGGYMLDKFGYNSGTLLIFVIEIVVIILMVIYTAVVKTKAARTKTVQPEENEILLPHEADSFSNG